MLETVEVVSKYGNKRGQNFGRLKIKMQWDKSENHLRNFYRETTIYTFFKQE